MYWKEKGNESFKEKNYQTALQHYTKAIVTFAFIIGIKQHREYILFQQSSMLQENGKV